MIKRWLITIGLFFIVQYVFILIDGTVLEPQLNHIGDSMTHYAGPKLEWFTLYESIILKINTMLFILYMVVAAVTDLIALRRR